MDCSEPRQFLLSVPYKYTEEMAFINNGILLTYKKKNKILLKGQSFSMGRQFAQSRKTHALVPRRIRSFCFVQIACSHIKTGLIFINYNIMVALRK